MKKLNQFYKILKIIFIIADVFVIGIYSAILIIALISGEGFWEATILIPVTALVFAIIEIILLKYYQNIVISVDFIDDCVVINTNKEKYVLPNKYFSRVKEEISNGRTYIFYNDGNQEKKFVYIMKYTPFKTHHLNISEMKKHMPFTVFE